VALASGACTYSIPLAGTALAGPAAAGRPLEAYAGAAVNRYHAWLEAPTGGSSRTALTPSGLVGFRVHGPPCFGACAAAPSGRTRRVTVAIEGHAALIRQRDDRRDLVPTLRVYVQVGAPVRRASRFPLTPPSERG